MKVLLLNPPNQFKISKTSRWPEWTKSGTLYYPFWLGYATSVLMESKHKPLLMDAIAKNLDFPSTIEKIQDFDPDLIVTESSTPSIHRDAQFADEVKKISDAKIVFTGRHVTATTEETMKTFKSIDIVARGEYDYTILDIANELDNGSNLKEVLGISFRNNGDIINTPVRPLVQNLDTVPFVSKAYREFLDVRDYRYALAQHPMLQIWSSRGCPNRCTYCIDGNSLIILKDKNETKVFPIKDFIDKIIEAKGTRIEDHDFADVSGLNLQVWSDNKFAELKRISRTKKNKILKIKCDKGYYIKVSGDHTIPVRRNGELIDVKAKDLKVGDEIIRTRPNNLTNSITELNLFEELIKNAPPELLNDIYIHNLGHYFECLEKLNLFKEIKNQFKSYWLQEKVLPVAVFSELVKKYGINRKMLEKLEIGGKNLIPTPLILIPTKELMQLIGFFVSEGNYAQYNIVITKSDAENIKTITNLIKKVFPKTFVSITKPTKERGGQITFGGKLIYLLFKYVLAIPEGAKNKRLPNLVFNVSEELAGACLAGAFTGDGLIDGRKVDYTTTSEVLANQVQTLLLAMKMDPSIKLANMHDKVSNYLGREIKTKNDVFHCYIGSWDDRQRFIEKIGFLDSRQNKLREFQEGHKPLRIKLLEHLDKPKTVAELSHELMVSQPMVRYMALRLNHEGFVLREQMQVGNTRKLKLSLKKASILRENVNEFARIKDIEESNHEIYLYDMETENSYFSANNVLVHNCDYPQVFTMHTFRMRSAQNVVDEMEYVNKELPNVKEIFLEDDTFTIDRNRVFEVCNLIKEKKLNLIWSCNVRANLDFDILKAMREAGCRILIVGYESGNQQILNNIKKGIALKQAEEFTKYAQKLGLRIFGCFMIGLPGDTRGSIEDTFQFAKKLNPDMVFFQQGVPFPGTEFFEWAKYMGYLKTRDYSKWFDETGRLDCLVNQPGLSGEDVRKLRENLMLRYYLNPKHIFFTLRRNLHPFEFMRVMNYAKDYFAFLMLQKIKRMGNGKQQEEIPVAHREKEGIGPFEERLIQ